MATTKISPILLKGASFGAKVVLTPPLVQWFKVIPANDGSTTIQISPCIIPQMSMDTLAPTRSRRVKGTTNGARKVSTRIIDSVRAIFPW
ncbi:hypothetical protein D3C71_1720980 [compost metagenome]